MIDWTALVDLLGSRPANVAYTAIRPAELICQDTIPTNRQCPFESWYKIKYAPVSQTEEDCRQRFLAVQGRQASIFTCNRAWLTFIL